MLWIFSRTSGEWKPTYWSQWMQCWWFAVRQMLSMPIAPRTMAKIFSCDDQSEMVIFESWIGTMANYAWSRCSQLVFEKILWSESGRTSGQDALKNEVSYFPKQVRLELWCTFQAAQPVQKSVEPRWCSAYLSARWLPVHGTWITSLFLCKSRTEIHCSWSFSRLMKNYHAFISCCSLSLKQVVVLWLLIWPWTQYLPRPAEPA